MTSESTPPPSSGGNLKYVVIGILMLLLAAGGLWWAFGSGPPAPPPMASADAGVGTARPTSLTQQQIEIPEPEPDAGPPWDAGGPRIRYVTRYVGGGGGGGTWDCSGDLDPAAVRSAVAEYKGQFRNCYERRLKVNNTLQGTVALSVKVGSSGRVSGVNVGGSLRDNEVFSCIRTIAQTMRFPAPSGGACAVVNAPFNFTPRSN